MRGNSNEGESSWWKRNAVYAVFLVLTCAFFYDTLFLGKVIMARDTFADFIPKLAVAKRALADFSIPLWNPQSGCGHPYIADPYTGSAYPLNALFHVLPAVWAHRLTLVLHFFLAGAGMISLARLWGFRDSAALLGAVGFVFSTNLASMIEFFNILFPVCWGPLIFYFGALFYEKHLKAGNGADWRGCLETILGDWKLVCLSALCLGMCYLSGNPQYLVFAILLAVAYNVGRLVYDRSAPVFAGSLLSFFLSGGIALLVCMPQILPFLELLGHSVRSIAIDPGYVQASIAWKHLTTFLLPFLFGFPGGVQDYWGGTIFEFWLGAFYVGLLPLVLGLFVFVCLPWKGEEGERWHRFIVIFAAFCCFVGLIFAAGNHLPVYDFLFQNLPGFDKVRWPSRFMLFTTYFIPLLGGLGLHRLMVKKGREGVSFRREWVLVGVIGAVTLIGWAGLMAGAFSSSMFRLLTGFVAEATPVRVANFRAEVITALSFASVFVLGLSLILGARDRSILHRLEWAIVVLAFINLATVSRQVQPTSSEDIYSYEPGIWTQFEEKKAEGDPHWRIFTKYGHHQFSLYGKKDPGAYKLGKAVSVGETWLQTEIDRAWRSSLSLGRYTTFFDLISMPNTPREVSFKFLRLLNVRYIITGPAWASILAKEPGAQVQVVPNENSLRRAYLVDSWRDVPSFEDGVRAMAQPDFNISSEIMLEAAEDGAMPSGNFAPGSAAGGKVTAIRYDWNRASIDVEAPGKCLLVLVDSWFPGWKATVNGTAAPIFKANLMFRAVEIPAGRTTVDFEYKPWRWTAGLVLAGVGIAIAVGGWLLGARSGSEGGVFAKKTPRNSPVDSGE